MVSPPLVLKQDCSRATKQTLLCVMLFEIVPTWSGAKLLFYSALQLAKINDSLKKMRRRVIVQCPYCVSGNDFRPMVADLDGRLVCSRSVHLANPGDGDFECVCPKCVDLRSEVERELKANLSGVVRALRQQLLRAHEQMSQVDAAIAALGNVIRRCQESPAAAGNRREDRKPVIKIAARSEHEIGKNRNNLNEEVTIQ